MTDHTDQYQAEIDRLRMELARMLSETSGMISKLYQLAGDLSALNVATAARIAIPVRIDPPEPRPYPEQKAPRKTRAPRKVRAPSKPSPPPSTTGLLVGSKDDELIDVEAAGEYLGLKARTLKAYRSRGEGPAYITVDGEKRNPYRYRKVDLDEWSANRRRKPKKPPVEQPV